MQEIFFESFFSLVQLSLQIKDEFFKEKLVNKTKEFFCATLIHMQGLALHVDKSVEQEKDVAQSVNYQSFLKTIGNLQELIEILVYLKMVDLSPALLAQKNLLLWQSEILGHIKPKTKLIRFKPPLQGLALRVDNSKHFKTKQLVFHYLTGKTGGVSLKEVAEYLKGRLSRRTIQRCLSDLISVGLIKKDRANGFPRYFPI